MSHPSEWIVGNGIAAYPSERWEKDAADADFSDCTELWVHV